MRKLPFASGSLVPLCFSRCIRTEPFPDQFCVANDMNKYDSTANPGTWLDYYLVARNIGGGNECIAFHNISLMLEGSARAWLNSLLRTSSMIGTTCTRPSSRTLRAPLQGPALRRVSRIVPDMMESRSVNTLTVGISSAIPLRMSPSHKLY